MNALTHGAACFEEPCPWCENRAEDRAADLGYGDDWQLGQDQYERHLDRMGAGA